MAADTNSDSFTSVSTLVDQILGRIKTASSAHKLLNYMGKYCQTEYGGLKDDAFVRCCVIGTENYRGKDDPILKCLLDLIDKSVFELSTEKCNTLIDYMVHTHTEELFFEALMRPSANQTELILECAMCEDMIAPIMSDC